ncbi:MAG TPA: phosphatidylglycerophosphatase A [Myxococcota bacterium]|nr:phosphatidylglycerophosphatase A [Myxococcota bacterium]
MPRLHVCARSRYASGYAVPQDPAIGTPAPRRLAVAIATAGGAGYAPVAPGTAGALVGVALYALLAPLGAVVVVVVACVLLAVGIAASNVAEHVYGHADDGRIVIDEVVGQLLALAPLPALAAEPRNPWLLLAGFLAFRLFDIWKPGPVRWAERNLKGGAGVMFDDVLAGLLAGACVAGLAAFTEGHA